MYSSIIRRDAVINERCILFQKDERCLRVKSIHCSSMQILAHSVNRSVGEGGQLYQDWRHLSPNTFNWLERGHTLFVLNLPKTILKTKIEAMICRAWENLDIFFPLDREKSVKNCGFIHLFHNEQRSWATINWQLANPGEGGESKSTCLAFSRGDQKLSKIQITSCPWVDKKAISLKDWMWSGL